MRSIGHRIEMIGRVVREEGPRALLDRLLDRWSEWQARRAYRAVAAEHLDSAFHTGVLNVSATPPAPRLGGVEAQLFARLEAEVRIRPVALLFPWANRWRLEVTAGDRHRRVDLGPAGRPSTTTVDGTGFQAATERAIALLGARAVHLESAHRLPWENVLALREEGTRLVLSVHDFALFCSRPQLLEEPVRRFCGYCRDLDRCDQCLDHGSPVVAPPQQVHRAAAGRLLSAADAVIFNSPFLRDRHQELFPGPIGGLETVVCPGTAAATVPPGRTIDERPFERIGFVGGGAAHKGARVLADVITRLRPELPGLRWTVYGGGPSELPTLRSMHAVRVRGYYRFGSLPKWLARDRIQLILLLSTWPETFSLALSETILARVPVVALDAGALAERTRAAGGIVVDGGDGARGVADVVRQIGLGHRPLPDRPDPSAVPTARDAARHHVQLYQEIGLLSSRQPAPDPGLIDYDRGPSPGEEEP